MVRGEGGLFILKGLKGLSKEDDGGPSGLKVLLTHDPRFESGRVRGLKDVKEWKVDEGPKFPRKYNIPSRTVVE